MLLSITALYCLAGFSLTWITSASADPASDLSAALAGHSSLTGFQQLVGLRADVVNQLVSESPSLSILAPSNDAFSSYIATTGKQLADEPSDVLKDILSYHILAASLTSTNFSASKGLTIPTLLSGELYNNRSAGTELVQTFGAGAGGQVVFTLPDSTGGFTIQAGGDPTGINLTALNQEWSKGYVHMVNQVLSLPKSCTDTMEDQPVLSELSESLEHTTVYDAIDTTPNVTCLAPDNQALAIAGDPQKTANKTAFSWLILSHVLPQALYPDHLHDQMQLLSVENTDIKVTLEGNNIFFNDAKVSATVLTNNGIVYVLDKVLADSSSGSSSTTAPSATSTTAPSSTSTSHSIANSRVAVDGYSLLLMMAGSLLAGGLNWT
ncbi:FAS1 domain-containing protein [Lasiosphaeria hispida]|uniref:FAS1 domain-containing protein n=1 Tax=Lasiosphaeria hispida TaxID=260671 RepID=A0AAJ0MBD9_9PEZI|nr:FAS1 domain-containing protein [Lasiosphaeria hispida]